MAENENNEQTNEQNNGQSIEDQIQKAEGALSKIDNNEVDIYFFTIDTQGNPTAGVANIYEMAKMLNDEGYRTHILHEKDDYHGVYDWMGPEYMELSHISIESQPNIGPEDILVVPEMFPTVMKQTKNLPCRKVVLCQSYYYLTETLAIGDRWSSLGFNDVITTSQKQADYVKELFPHVNISIIPVSIPDYFKPTDKLKEPTIAIHTRDQSETMRIVKTFYLQFPQYKWIPFHDMRGMPRKTFANSLSKACLAVWVDDVAGFGTFPVEAMECETPVIGKVPELIPEWMTEKDSEGNEQISGNGIWTNSKLAIPELISKYMKLWLEDQHPQELFDEMKKMQGVYNYEAQKEKTLEQFNKYVSDKKKEIENKLEEIKSSTEEKNE